MFRHRLSFALDGVLLPNQNVELKALPKRCHQEEGPIRLGIEILLEVIDRDLWGMVSVRLCMILV